MTEKKRYTYKDLHYMGMNEMLELVNGLLDENEQLKQFKNTVFDCINKKIEEVDTIGTEVLKDLRRELNWNDK